MSTDNVGQQLVVTLQSGSALNIRQVMLFDEASVAEIVKLRSEAATALGPSGSFIGVGGSPSTTLAAEAVALGVITGLLASAAKKTAIEKLTLANQQYQSLKSKGVFIPIGDISNIWDPAPGLWFGFSGFRSVTFGQLPLPQQSVVMRERNVKYTWDMNGAEQFPMPIRRVHTGDDFIQVMTDGGHSSFRWSTVSQFQFIELARADLEAQA